MQPEIEVGAEVLEVLRSGEPDTGKKKHKPRDIATGWKARLIQGQRGPKALVANAIAAMRHAPEWKDVLSFNQSAIQTIGVAPPFAKDRTEAFLWSDTDDILTADWLQHEGIDVNKSLAGQAIEAVAKDKSFHPIRDYFESLVWDGTKRIDGWLTLYLGVDQSDYARAVGARFLISGVARIFKPGCKVDTCLILEGDQGKRKSTALRVLAGDEFFTDDIADLGSKDSVLQTRGMLLIELAELDSVRKPEQSRIKAFMSRQEDRVRLPYARRVCKLKRECIFAGTTNSDSYLKDETGARRFWPVACGEIRDQELARDRNQLWAEAVVRYRAKDKWWLDTKELTDAAAEEAEARYESDPWDELIAAWIKKPRERFDQTNHPVASFDSNPGFVTTNDILIHCLGKAEGALTRPDQMRVARALKVAKWTAYRLPEEPRTRGYIPC